jgi:hypothetical protein
LNSSSKARHSITCHLRGLEDYLEVSMLEGCIESFIMQKHSTNCHLQGFENQKVSMFDASNSS